MTRTEYLQKIQPCYTGYQELHVHTEASYRDAVNTVDDIVAAAKRLGRNAFAITDHGNQMRLFQGFKVRTKAEKKALEDALKAAAVPKDDCDSILKSIGPTDSIRNPTEKMWPWIEKYPEPFIAAVKNSPQYIPGIEMYFQPEKSEDDNSGYHIILYAKDWQGQKVLFLIENLAQLNKNKSGNPRTTWEDLERFVGPGALGHGHVIATSACVAGYIPSILLRRWHIADRQAELQAKLGTEDIAFSEDDLKKAETDEETAKEKLSTAKKELAQVKKLAKTDFSTKLGKLRAKVTSIEEKEKALAGQLSFGDMTAPSAKLQAARDKLAAMEAEAEKAKKAETNLPEYVRQVEQCKVLYDITKQHTDTIKKALRPLEKYKAAIEELEQEKSALGDLNAEAKAAALRFDELFGHGNFYIELQNHGITKENVVRPMLYQLIRDTGIPPTVANDVHYPTKEDKRKRDIIFAMKFNRQISEFENEEGIDQLYFKSNEEMAALADDEFWNIGMENTCRIAESCNVYYDKQMHLPTFDAHAAGFPDAKAYLEDFCHKMIPKKYPIDTMADDKRKELLQTIEERLAYEFGVIEKMGYMSYIAIVQDFIFYGRKIGGQTAIGPGRGSAAGSLVCYLADITDIDPLRYDLLFERFLNPARVSMPDIDTDLSGAVRGKVIDYVAQKYGYKGDYPCEELRSTVCNIATESVLAPRAAVRAVARVTGVPYDVTDQLAKMIPNVPKMTLEKAENDNPEIAGFCNIDPRAKKLFEEAKLVEGIPVQTGVHAAGVIIADKPVSEYAPMFWNDEKNCWVIESDMVECESTLGLLKMDFLGLTTLDILGTTLFYIRKTRGMNIKLAKLKEANDQNVIQHIYAEGNTDGVFQFESDGIKKALVNFKPHSIDDIILMNAAYRPGPMDSIPEFTAVKLGEKDPAYLVPDMEKILGNTYGSAIYQEQIMQLFQMVGFSLGEADIIRRAMSKKHLDEIEAAKEKFVAGMKAKGASDEAVEAYWTRLLAFASYAFNKSHAAAYSILSYYTAWLKFYSPCEFMAAQMSYTPHDKVPLYARECKRLGIALQKPDINKGVPFFAPNKGEKTIRYGIASIKGVANSAQTIYDLRTKYGPCVDIRDFTLRCLCFGISADTMQALCNSGALDDVIGGNENRRMIAKAFGYKEDKTEKDNPQLIDSAKMAIRAVKKEQPDISDEALYKLLMTGNKVWVLPDLIQYEPYSPEKRLEKEYELLNLYVTGNPIDPYLEVIQKNREDGRTIAGLENGDTDVSVVGLIHSLQISHRKKDGAAFAKFVLEDETGLIHCVVFTSAYERLRSNIQDKTVTRISGKVAIEENRNNNDNANETEQQKLQLRVSSATRI